MHELMKLSYDNDRITLSARELHEFLESNERFSKWFDRMVTYGFSDGIDFTTVQKSTLVNNGAQRELQDYQITIEMAKEIAMLQRSDKGKEARHYFIQLEKEWNSPERVMARALLLADEKIQALKLENKIKDQQIGELKPKADYYDEILKNKGLVNITQIAKDYGMSGSAMNQKLHELGIQFKQSGQWLLYAKYHDKGYTHSETFDFERSDGRSDVKMNTKWTQKGRVFLYELLKQNGILPLIEKA